MVQKRDNIDLEIILLLLRGESHLRAIARQLGESHSTVLRKINKLVKENVLNYKTVGRNRVFSIKKNLQAKNYTYNAERYKLMKLLSRYPELNVIIEEILKKSRDRLVVLFGSYAKFGADRQSDIDIYVESNSARAKKEMEMVNSKINAKTGTFNQNSPLIREIIRNHVILRGVEEFYEKTGYFEQA